MMLQPEKSEKGDNLLDTVSDEDRKVTGRKTPGILQCRFLCYFLGFRFWSRLLIESGSRTSRQHSDPRLAV